MLRVVTLTATHVATLAIGFLIGIYALPTDEFGVRYSLLSG